MLDSLAIEQRAQHLSGRPATEMRRVALTTKMLNGARNIDPASARFIAHRPAPQLMLGEDVLH